MIAACPSGQRLREFSLGQLNEEQSDLLFTHVSDCVDCQQVLSQDADDDSLIARLRDTTTEGNDFSQEAEYQIAMTKALAALAQTRSSGELSEQKLPEKIGDYEIVRMIGRGGMGNVYLANHAKLGRQVALKVIAGHRAADPKMRGRFETEMQAVGKLNHSNIVNALDAREVDGVAILVTEWIDGLDLGEIVRRVGPLAPADAAKVVEQVSNALMAVDKAGLVHRDIKPSNIMISSVGEVKLLDLGLARLQGDDAGRDMTATGQAIGTADYLAPEQVNGTDSVDIRADIYGLGCTLYKLLTGAVPFGGPDHASTFAKMTAHVSSEPPQIDLPGIPAALASLTSRMMAKEIDRRPALAEISSVAGKNSAEAKLKSLVSAALAIESSHFAARRESEPVESKPAELPWWRRRIPVSFAIASGLAGILLGLFLGIIITIKKPDGTTTTLEVPDGSRVSIDEQGNALVDLGRNLPTPGNDSRDSLSRLKGVWRLEFINTSDGALFSDEHLPNLMVFGGNGNNNRTALLRDNRVMAIGTVSQRSSSPSIGFKFQPPEGVNIPEGAIFWLPTQLEGNLVFGDEDLAEFTDLFGIRESEDGSDEDRRLMGMELILRKEPIGGEGDLHHYVRRAAEKRELRRALVTLVEFEIEGMDMPWDVQSQLNQIKSKENLLQLALAMHNYHEIHKHLPASQITKDGSAHYSPVLGAVADGQVVSIVRTNATVAINLGSEDNVALGQSFDVYGQQSSEFKSGHGKATLVVTRIIGDHLAEARITSRTFIGPVLNRDFVVSSDAWNPGYRVPVAIVGQIDLDGDGATDVQRLINIVERSGYGKVVAYHDETGNIFGEIDEKTRFFVMGKEPTGDSSYGFERLDTQRRRFQTRIIRLQDFLNEMGFRSNAKIKRFEEEHPPNRRRDEIDANPDVTSAKDSDGIHPYSWRVAILPWLGEQALYDQYRFDEPWYSDHNQKLIDQMPDVFRYPGDRSEKTKTRYHAITGPQSAIGVQEANSWEDVLDGAGSTIMLVEASEPVPWTKPEDIFYDPDDPTHPNVEWLMNGICNVAFADASVRSMKVDVSKMDVTKKYPGQKVLEALFTRSRAENYDHLDIFDE